MEKHVTVVGAIHIAFSALGIMGAVTALLFIVGGGLIGGFFSGEEAVVAITAIVGTAIAFWAALLSVPGIVGGVGLLKWKSWARYLVLVLAVLDLFNIPIGTAVGVYSIWVLVQDETARLFSAGSSQ
jgi:hypothetical protein